MSEIVRASIIPDYELLEKLEPRAEELFANHVDLSDKLQWYPHKETPWSFAKDFEPDYIWTPEDAIISEELGAALLVNLLTEDNLPYYFEELGKLFGKESIWRRWAGRWTAEEGRHAIVIRNGLSATRLVDPVLLEDDRMDQVSNGITPEFESTLDGIMYVALQELATLISHQRTLVRMKQESALLTDIDAQAAIRIMGGGLFRVIGDEARHHMFYLGLAKEAIRLKPDEAMKSLRNVVMTFTMPGTGINDFDTRSSQIADLGIYDTNVHVNLILKPVIESLDVKKNTDVGAEGNAARKELLQFVRILGGIAVPKERKEREEARSRLILPPNLS